MWHSFLSFLQLTIIEGPAPEGALVFEDVAFVVEHAQGKSVIAAAVMIRLLKHFNFMYRDDESLNSQLL